MQLQLVRSPVFRGSGGAGGSDKTNSNNVQHVNDRKETWSLDASDQQPLWLHLLLLLLDVLLSILDKCISAHSLLRCL